MPGVFLREWSLMPCCGKLVDFAYFRRGPFFAALRAARSGKAANVVSAIRAYTGMHVSQSSQVGICRAIQQVAQFQHDPNEQEHRADADPDDPENRQQFTGESQSKRAHSVGIPQQNSGLAKVPKSSPAQFC